MSKPVRLFTTTESFAERIRNFLRQCSPHMRDREWHQLLEQAASELQRLENLVYVPGMHKCAKCKYVHISSTMHAEPGLMKANNSAQACPNGCGPLWRVTERDSGNDLADRLAAAISWNYVSEGKLPTHPHSVLMHVTGGLLHHGQDYIEVGIYINGVWRHEVDGVDLPVIVSRWRMLPPL